MVLLLDGGFESQLIKHVKKIERNPLWCSKYLYTLPNLVVQTHYDYVKAGADIITTNTFQANLKGFQEHLNLSEEESIHMISKAVDLVHEAVKMADSDRKILVAGSIGPYGASLLDGSEYRGDYIDQISEDELIAWHEPRIKTLVEKKVDLLAVETIPSLKEALIILKILKNYPEQKAWISFSIKDNDHIGNGQKFVEVVKECWNEGSVQLVAMGMNCLHPDLVAPLLKSVEHLNIPMIVYPNSGEIWEDGIGYTNKEKTKPLVTYLPEWLELGVQYIGGCCQSTDEDIHEMRKYLNSNQ
uniref:Hcy-binding domain-containing protein n=1 Tax=Clastoptera arizonana TaxID=38151 RepID=A0A1B6C7R6_9HEMI